MIIAHRLAGLLLVAALALIPTSAHAEDPASDGYAECQPSMTDKCPQPQPESCEDRLSGFRAALLESREEGHRLRAELWRVNYSLTAARERIDAQRKMLTSVRAKVASKNDRIAHLRKRIARLRG